MVRKLLATFAAGAVFSLPAAAAGPAPVKLVVKPLLCVLDKAATSCMMSFDVRWKSAGSDEYCLNDSTQGDPLHCWASALSGAWLQEREVSEEFTYWLGRPGGTDHLAEVKVTVLKVGSDDRRRERRARHVWDVL
ncbi:MAG TPA: DUF3019 domain-containing protein [Steroidobacteraceae bacterium]|nr:DUF3019 domain-containing protein [Steroidobacteraceae bacterium]